MSATELIPVFIHPEPGSYVRLTELAYSCRELFTEEGGGTAYTPLLAFQEALEDAGYRLARSGRRMGANRRPLMIRDADWNDPALAAEAEANRIAAESQRTNALTGNNN